MIMSQIFYNFAVTNTAKNSPFMAVEVYVITDPLAINFIVNDDSDGFKEYLDSEDMLDFREPEVFDTEDAVLSFCVGLGYGADECAIPDCYPLRSCEPADISFIEAIENY